MIHIIAGLGEPHEQPLLNSMFEARKRLFVDLLDWDLDVVDERFEIDRFDDAYATYIIVANDAGLHRASMRLLPSVRPHLLGSMFERLCTDGVPVGPDIFEITRLCLPATELASERRLLRNGLIRAMVDHALEHGIRRFTGVVTARFREQVLAMGWQGEALGPGQDMGGGRLGAFAIDICEDTPAHLDANCIHRLEDMVAVNGAEAAVTGMGGAGQ
ncbi:acyl-homoserine lactone synthase [Sphingopyxis sp. YR583]|uniref:acyl-homoserine-lactone synthase n=1 Tax=Sphingopyxis sp. YR583 TaxID=1881047 RepID=UPI0008A740A9|nr:acyl-homoserine-lactone synthase [Sphingopyxis sp. YR583]SEH12841.1 acyl-homoserine lactone synthase [Sphingopyxis sp. YR583]